jgi:hypothetical protein
VLHSTERYYPLRPEIVESTYYLFRATNDPTYLEMGRKIFENIETTARVPGGYASIKGGVCLSRFFFSVLVLLLGVCVNFPVFNSPISPIVLVLRFLILRFF